MNTPFDAPSLGSLEEIEQLLAAHPSAWLRYSEGHEFDAEQVSVDYESGLTMPGLSVMPLTPPHWWTRPARDWVARQISKYLHLVEENPERRAWILSGTPTGRGPDQEPLVVDARPIAELAAPALTSALAHYRAVFAAGNGPEGYGS